MRKRPDIIFILSILVVVGVIISSFIVIKPNHKMDNESFVYTSFTSSQSDKSIRNSDIVNATDSSLF